MSERCTRRDLFRLGLGACVTFSGLEARAATPAQRIAGKSVARYFLQVFVSGGLDAIYTTDPKSRTEVEPWVDVPYRSNDIVAAGAVQLGPHFAALAPSASRLAFVNGVQVNTANHETGTVQFNRLRTRADPKMPEILELIGSHRDTQVLGSINSGDWLASQFQPQDDLFPYVEDTSPADLAVMSAAVRKQSSRLRSVAPRTADNLEQTARLFDRLPQVQRFEKETWSDSRPAQDMAVKFQRVIWAFKNDLARCFYVNLGSGMQPWDTHSFNTNRQSTWSHMAIPMFQRFLQTLEQTSGAYGKLAENTAVVFGSEIGRFPRLNGSEGKDHLPEIPLVLYGAGFKTGAVYGKTDRSMRGMPVALDSGQAQSDGHPITLDDIGATLLHVSGVQDPSVYGYSGSVLPFLV